jgi:predicted anti-sigma-YlaC factor YlaD
VDVRCSLVRETLSAWADGEDGAARPLDVSRHLATCRGCTAYAEHLGTLSDLTRALQGTARPEPAPEQHLTGEPARPASRRLLGLRLGVVALSLLELASVVTDLVGGPGYGGEDHAGHESLSFTLAVCAGLLWVAWRPAYARAYLPLVGVAAVLLGATATVDVVRGRAEVSDELPHVGFLVGFVLLWLLAHRGARRAGPIAWVRRAAEPGRGHLRVVRGSLRAVVAFLPAAVTLPLDQPK